MCGRYTLRTDKTNLAAALEIPEDAFPEDLAPRYNIAPTELVPILIQDTEVRVTLHRWGLVPSWAKDRNMGSRLINARRETITQKPSFRDAFRERRCLVVADGFYEWLEVEKRKPKIPHYIHLKGGGPFTFAGLWSKWRDPDGPELYTCTIITTEPNDLVRRVHDRMPVIIPPERRSTWLDPANGDETELQALLEPYDQDHMEMYPVTTYVNSPGNEGDLCIEPASDWQLF
ncbi:MAG: SOS response-associated peptidase [Gemmatimonadetes bacterium]|nr:SOS response-associated peptidase [Gemmatimonadota bacterium]